jgi:hypothetical protein
MKLLAYVTAPLLILGALYWWAVDPYCAVRDVYPSGNSQHEKGKAPEPTSRTSAEECVADNLCMTVNALTAQSRSQHREDEQEGAEYWPRYCGFRVKITDSLLAVFTALLFGATCGLWMSTNKVWAVSSDLERAYLTGGGDVRVRGGKLRFRVDVANYGKTAAYLTNYEIKFAPKLADVQSGPLKIYKPRRRGSCVFDDRIAPNNETKVIEWVDVEPANAEIIYGCFWYADWQKRRKYFRFILRVNRIDPLRPRTVPNVDGVHESYREWT